MVNEVVVNVNWIAVIVSAVVAYALGFVWYGLLFGKQWASGLAISPPERMPVLAMSLQAAGTLFFAWLFGIASAEDAHLLAVLVTSAIVALIAAGGLYAQKPGPVVLIEGGYVVAMAIAIFAVQALF